MILLEDYKNARMFSDGQGKGLKIKENNSLYIAYRAFYCFIYRITLL